VGSGLNGYFDDERGNRNEENQKQSAGVASSGGKKGKHSPVTSLVRTARSGNRAVLRDGPRQPRGHLICKKKKNMEKALKEPEKYTCTIGPTRTKISRRREGKSQA